MKIKKVVSHRPDELEREIVELIVFTLYENEVILTIHDFKIDEENIKLSMDCDQELSEEEWDDIKEAMTKAMIGTFSDVLENELQKV